MKRKLIAVALACALVFSMIPSLAFAAPAEAVTDAKDLPRNSEVAAQFEAIDDFFTKYDETNGDSFDDLTLDDKYKDVADAIAKLEYTLAMLELTKEANKGDTSGDLYTGANGLLTDYSTEIGEFRDTTTPTSPRGIYNTKMASLLSAAIVDAKLGNSVAIAEDYAGYAAQIAPIVSAALTMVAENNIAKGATTVTAIDEGAVVGAIDAVAESTNIDAGTQLANAEITIFEKVVKAEFNGCYTYDSAKSKATVTTAPSEAAIEAVTNAIPKLSPSYAGEGMIVYEAVMQFCNANPEAAWVSAMANLNTQWAKGDVTENAKVVQYIKEARAAYAQLVGEFTLSPTLSTLQAKESEYVEKLIAAANTEYTSPSNGVDNAMIAATEAARKAYDELMAFDKTSGEEHVVTNVALLETLEGHVQAHYEAAMKAAYDDVKDIKAAADVKAENKTVVETYIAAYDKYVATLSAEEKTKFETAKSTKEYAEKYAIVKAGLEALTKAEADADAATKAELEALRAELEQLKKDEEANAAEIAALQAKIKFMESKVKNVKVTVGKKKATIKWKKVEGAAKYKVYRATSKNGKFKAVKTTAKVKFTNKKLKSGKNYFYKVVAVYGDGALSKDSKIVKSKKIK